MNLIFATHNQHKTEEIRSIVKNHFTVLNLKDIGCFEDIPETSDTIAGNALLKARYVQERYGFDCFADDTGLEVESLDYRPGVYSARYAGENCSYEDNVVKILQELDGIENRKACFRTVIALVRQGKEYFFEGVITGVITKTPRGNGGFGYDPVFCPDGYMRTFAELGDDVKNSISHRAIAVEKLLDFLIKK